LRGFGLRLRIGSGDKLLRSWLIQTRMQGRMRRMLIGSAEVLTAAQARKEATKLLAKIKLGGDPASEKDNRRQRDSMSLRSVIVDYLEQKTGVKEVTAEITRYYLLGPLGKRAKKRNMEPFLKPLHALPIDRVTRRDIASRVLHVKTASGVASAIGLRGALSAFFRWAMETGLVEQNPVMGALKPERPEPRERVLSNAELVKLWKNVGDDDYGKVVKLLMTAGGRRSEIGKMQWLELDLDRGTWTLPSSRSKNKRPHTLPLTPLMLKIIGSLPVREGNDHLFGRKGFTAWAACKKIVDERLGFEPPWTHHDIRRSVATGMADIGIQPHIIEQILNHQSGHRRGVAGTYNRSPYEREVRDAMLRWSDHIRSLIEGDERKVLSFEQRAIASTP
jgi:integrase